MSGADRRSCKIGGEFADSPSPEALRVRPACRKTHCDSRVAQRRNSPDAAAHPDVRASRLSDIPPADRFTRWAAQPGVLGSGSGRILARNTDTASRDSIACAANNHHPLYFHGAGPLKIGETSSRAASGRGQAGPTRLGVACVLQPASEGPPRDSQEPRLGRVDSRGPPMCDSWRSTTDSRQPLELGRLGVRHGW